MTIQSPTATLIPFFPAQSSLGADILVYWIGKKSYGLVLPVGVEPSTFCMNGQHPIHLARRSAGFAKLSGFKVLLFQKESREAPFPIRGGGLGASKEQYDTIQKRWIALFVVFSDSHWPAHTCKYIISFSYRKGILITLCPLGRA